MPSPASRDLPLALPLALVVTALLTPALALIDDFPVVTTDQGSSILGRKLTSAGLRSGSLPRDYAAFFGVPYAKAPVGNRRFRPPVPEPLPSVVDAKMPTPGCLQLNRQPSDIVGSEDCLTLQIFTPNYDRAAGLDVIVHIHGGGFMFGNAARTGLQYLMDYDVVVVTVGYRLGVLGYLSFEDEELPGNVGMLDQVQALRWVQENIVYFGGNKQSITLAGFSAGAASVLMHTLSPLSKGLFHKAVAMSGSPLNPWAVQPAAAAKAKRLAEMVGCTGADTAALVSCLQASSATVLVALQSQFQGWRQHPAVPFGPVVDSQRKTPFLPLHPADLLDKQTSADVPLLLSVANDDGLFPAAEFILEDSLVQELDDRWAEVGPMLLHLHVERADEIPCIMQNIREHYLQKESLRHSRKQLVELISDRTFFSGVNDFALTAAATWSSPVYMYRFKYRGQYSLTTSLTGGNTTDLGVCHGDDDQYIFEESWSGVMQTATDLDMRRQLIELWVSFAKNSIPVLSGGNWTPLSKVRSDVLQILDVYGPGNVTMVHIKDFGQTAFWSSLQCKTNGTNSARSAASLLLFIAGFIVLVFKTG
ncbi:venom carboxylesterase-6-like isoform X5 [Frankliniella occidentalis]|uniref:Carboxylic ester hydrolase n=1 Tax=Frankliniella occidentalis TaxID=133901 RepID=A0A9C6WX53_FRAOC|nr:venom carboxylesterase-6-like isoform X2 [Frankliniella occidentalis]XP_052119536.1 venom carboxylesterase-6-like isoform X3 [Frankliniella occidentalis]XP_052119537.1 venom carboxylesterase-6-like isoform X4 [Frankliniella occidentalis]XP_052119538.1 venom carboxylesterase-6-like isoform X5 [Frankliniella occidentalis]